MFRSGFFDSTSVIANPEGYPQGNKAETADFFAAFWASIIGDGIPYYPTSNFLVTPKTGMTVEVQPGKAYKNAYMAWDEAATEITIDTSAEARTLYIGIRLNETGGEFTGGIEARAAFDADSDVVFAKLTIPANVVVITNAMIEDTRSSATYCGYVNDIEERLADLEQELRDQITLIIAGGVPHHATTHATGGADAITPSSIGAIPTSEKGAANGVATLDADGKVAEAQSRSSIITKSASVTLALSDAGKFIMGTSAAAKVFTIPANATVAFPIGTEMEFFRSGGTVTFAPASGVSLYSTLGGGNTLSRTISNALGVVGIKKITTDGWVISGDVG